MTTALGRYKLYVTALSFSAVILTRIMQVTGKFRHLTKIDINEKIIYS